MFDTDHLGPYPRARRPAASTPVLQRHHYLGVARNPAFAALLAEGPWPATAPIIPARAGRAFS
ncbi:MAG: hypothetical protein WKG07_24225 [Hymenobacter sp.]